MDAREEEEPKMSQVSGLGDQNDSSFVQEKILVLLHTKNSPWDRNQDEWSLTDGK